MSLYNDANGMFSKKVPFIWTFVISFSLPFTVTMGNNVPTSTLRVDNEFSSKKEICEEADKYSHLLGKQNRIYCNQDNLLYVVCAK